jgi:ribosomal-protein-alanine N-acetyltransferase
MKNKFSVYNSFPVFKLTKEYNIREIKPETDWQTFLNYISNPDIQEFLADDDMPSNQYSAMSELNYWSGLYYNRNGFYWAIDHNGVMIGCIGFNYWNVVHNRAEISYDLDFNYWGKGIMTKAVGVISDFAIKQMQVTRIQATVAEKNIGSVKVLEKNGYIKEGLMKNFCLLHGKLTDFYMFGLAAK